MHSPRQATRSSATLTPAELRGRGAARGRRSSGCSRAFDRRYEELKEQRSALDFQDLELGALELLRSSPALAAAWRERFDHVMVDEFQDTNSVQLELIEPLRGPETRLLLVGDENQSIYRFRNADLEVFRGERADGPGGAPTATCCRCSATSARCPAVLAARQRGRAHAARRLRRADRGPRRPAAGPATSSCC